jgi:hypothetical protein
MNAVRVIRTSAGWLLRFSRVRAIPGWLTAFRRRRTPRCVDCGAVAMPGEARCLACCGS